ncbi:hypothetical protein [Streptomyces xanthii]|uniref:Uncharacterized protein n=1 Tax=Streptomyces xanthii TaxID=2768069 RepID=A0A7H1BH96_9ACTN|nr:hypothetical protein [Streptomyces xanthii]QNS08101.1 hypothetical protein IAG42_33805 [Streptomyces xanthii]
MSHEGIADPAAAARSARFGKLPERVRFEDMSEGADTEAAARANATYDPEGQWKFYSCLALDLGL